MPARATPSPELDGTATLDDLTDALVALRKRAGTPSYAEIARRITAARMARGLSRVDAPGRITVYDCFRRGRSRIDVDLLADIVSALGAGADVDAWRAAHAAIEAPGERAVVSVATTVPEPTARFTGRRESLARLTGESEGITLIVGMPGIGKTELALAAASAMADDFAATLYVNLRGYDQQPAAEPAAVLTGALRALGVRSNELWQLDLAGLVARATQAVAATRPLLVLDNAREPEQLRPLLAAFAAARVLVTSRNREVAPAAQVIDLEVLSVEESLDLLSKLVPDQVLDPADPMAVRLVEMCGRLPLYLGLTGARMRETASWTMEDQVRRLETFPNTGQVNAALRLSYQSLPEDEGARIFRLVTMVPGGSASIAALAVMADLPPDAVRPAVHRLLAENLVMDAGHDRVRVHDLVRDFGLRLGEDLEPLSSRRAAMGRLLDYYTRSTAAAIAALLPVTSTEPRTDDKIDELVDEPLDPEAARTWLDRKWSTVLTVAMTAPEWDLTDDLAKLAEVAGPWLEAEARFAEAEPLHLCAAESSDAHLRAVAAQNLSRIYDFTSRNDLAETWAQRAVAEDGPDLATSLGQLGTVFMRLGRLERARGVLKRAVDEARHRTDRRAEGRLLMKLASALLYLDRLDEAEQTFGAARTIAAEEGDLHTLAMVHSALGDQYLLTGRGEEGRAEALAAMDLEDRMGQRQRRPKYLRMLGHAATLSGDHHGAIELADAAFDEAVAIHSPLYAAEALVLRSMAELSLGHNLEAGHTLDEALRRGRALDSRWVVVDACNGLGEVALRTGRMDDAHEHFTEALVTAEQMGEPHEAARARVGLGDVAERSGDRETAVDLWQQALPHFRMVDAPEVAGIEQRIESALGSQASDRR